MPSERQNPQWGHRPKDILALEQVEYIKIDKAGC